MFDETGKEIIGYDLLPEDDSNEFTNETSTTLGEKLEYSFKIKAQIEELKSRKSELEKVLERLTIDISEEMNEKDLEKIECAYGSGKIKTDIYPNVKDWNVFMDWVSKNKRYEFVEKRVSRTATREMLATYGEIPEGIDVYPKTTLELRKKPKRRK